MKNTKNAVIYGGVGGATGFGISKLFKAGTKVTWGVTIALAIAGGYFGNKS